MSKKAESNVLRNWGMYVGPRVFSHLLHLWYHTIINKFPEHVSLVLKRMPVITRRIPVTQER